jgi:hypothetical protein
MRTNCSRGCCYSDDGGGQRQRERLAWLRDWRDEECSIDAEWKMWLDYCDWVDLVESYCDRFDLPSGTFSYGEAIERPVL